MSQKNNIDTQSLQDVVEAIKLFKDLFIGNPQVKSERMKLRMRQFATRKLNRERKLIRRIREDVRKGKYTEEIGNQLISKIFEEDW